MNNWLTLPALALAFATASEMPAAQAGVSADEARQLGTKLTLVGAEPAGNADGSIPPYTGGIMALAGRPAPIPHDKGYRYPDPFATDKKIVSITAQNLEQYGNLLSPGQKALLRRLPGFRMDVYPTHRTASYPDWVLKNTVRNAEVAQLAGSSEGDGVKGAYGGIPFPIPKNGSEVIWNHYLHWQPALEQYRFYGSLVDADGGVTDLGEAELSAANLYYDPKAGKLDGMFYSIQYYRQLSPETAAGNLFLFEYPVDYSVKDQTTWFYSPGLRRVRMAPEFTYDTPVSTYGGAQNYDELNLISGRLDKFDFKLAGKKEMLVPYNCYRVDSDEAQKADVVGPKYPNPDLIRYEKHRVWVVEATLKPGERHVSSRRTFFVDEDSWKVLLTESYDQAGSIYRVIYQATFPTYDSMDTTFVADAGGSGYDMSKGNYFFTHHAGPKGFFKLGKDLPNLSTYTPEAMAGKGVR